GVDDGLAGGADDDRLLQLLAPAVGDAGELGAEAFDVVGLALDVALGDEQGEVGVAGPGRLDAGVQLGHHALPYGVAVGADDHRAPHGPVVGQLGPGHHVLVPAGEVLALGGEHGRLLGLRHRRSMVGAGASRPPVFV